MLDFSRTFRDNGSCFSDLRLCGRFWEKESISPNKSREVRMAVEHVYTQYTIN